jgi:hypothetical protein
MGLLLLAVMGLLTMVGLGGWVCCGLVVWAVDCLGS